MEINDRFEVFKEACKAMDEGKWRKAEVDFRTLATFCWQESLRENMRKAGYDSK